MTKKKALIRDELLAIQRKSRKKILDPKAVIKWAKDHPESALHAAIEWRDAKAADEYRLFQVRRLIQLHVVTEDGEPVLVSLTVDRSRGGGYRPIEDVAASPDLSKIMLRDALNELSRVQAKYERVKELAAVWKELDRVRKVQPQEARVAA